MKDLRLTADPIGEAVPQNPRLALVGSGPRAYLWIGSDGGFVGVARNSPELRRFLRRALARLEKEGRR